MAPRRAHTKSRFGCLACKRRRVKCDETGPPCGPCQTRQIECSFPPRQALTVAGTPSSQLRVSPSITEERSRSSNSSHTLKAPPTPDPSFQGSRRLLELELMHQYSFSTYVSFTGGCESEQSTWQSLVPEVALQQPYLLDGLFAITALHIAATRPDIPNRGDYQNAALEYYDRALVAFRSELGSVTLTNQRAAFAFSVITMIWGLAFPQFLRSHDQSQGMCKEMVSYYYLTQGAGQISIRNWDEFQHDPLVKNSKRFESAVAEPLDPEIEDALNNLNKINRARQDDNPEMEREARLKNMTNYSACRKAIFFLEDGFAKVNDEVGKESNLIWLNLSGKDFVTAIDEEDPVALLALMHWGLLTQTVGKGVWWAESIGNTIGMEIAAKLVSETNPEFVASLNWVSKKVGL